MNVERLQLIAMIMQSSDKYSFAMLTNCYMVQLKTIALVVEDKYNGISNLK